MVLSLGRLENLEEAKIDKLLSTLASFSDNVLILNP